MDLAFVLKKVISAALMPLSISLFILFIALLFLNTRTIQKTKLFIAISFISLVLIAYEPFANFLLKPLETKYEKITVIPQDITHILLLGGDATNRAWEALRLYHKIDNAKIITSGYEGNRKISEAVRTAQLLQESGVKKDDIIIHSKPKDTKEEAIKTKELLGTKPFLLVTSAISYAKSNSTVKKRGSQSNSSSNRFENIK